MAGLSGVTSQIFEVVVVVVLAMYRYSGLCLVTIGVVIHCASCSADHSGVRLVGGVVAVDAVGDSVAMAVACVSSWSGVCG